MSDDTLLPFPLPAIKPKKVIAAFDGGQLSSDGDVAFLALAEKRVGIVDRLARLFSDDPDQERVTHPLDSIVGAASDKPAQKETLRALHLLDLALDEETNLDMRPMAFKRT